MQKVVFFGTHPKQFNGYSKVVYELSKNICKHDDIDLTVFGFQRFFKDIPQHRDDIKGYKIYDAHAGEKEESKTHGFGINEVVPVLTNISPDVCIIYNDMMIVSNILKQINIYKKQTENTSMKVIVYVDQVYLNQKKEYIKFLNENTDHVIAFTKYWEDIIKEQGLQVPTSILEHGFNSSEIYPIDKKVARQYFSIDQDAFIIMNLNRNQPRKRWDTCIKAFAEIVYRLPSENIKLLIATSTQGAWNLVELYERELSKRNVSLEKGLKHLIIIDRPQQMSDFETNILYNIADVGINTCDGEGFGLCNFEQGGIGIPQIIPNLGGFKDFFKPEFAEMIEPKMSIYIDNSRDAVAGEALLTDYIDYVEAIEKLYFNIDLREEYKTKSREFIMTNYKWDVLAERVYDLVYTVTGKTKPQPVIEEKEVISLPEQEIRSVADSPSGEPSTSEPATATAPTADTDATKSKKKKLKKKKSKSSSKDDEIEMLKKQIAMLMEARK